MPKPKVDSMVIEFLPVIRKNINLKSIKTLGNAESIQIHKYFNELNKKNINIGYGLIINFPKDKPEIDCLKIENK